MMRYVSCLDVGLTRDHTACVTVHVDDPSGVVLVDDVFHQVGTRAQPVRFALIEERLVRLSRRLPQYRCIADQWQAQQLIERLRGFGVSIRPVVFGAAYHDAIARHLMDLVHDGRVKCYPHDGLQRQLRTVVTKRSSAMARDDSSIRVKIDAGAGAGVAGKDDLVVALAGAAYEASALRRHGPSVAVIKVGDRDRPPPPSESLTLLRARKTAALEAMLRGRLIVELERTRTRGPDDWRTLRAQYGAETIARILALDQPGVTVADVARLCEDADAG